MIFIRIFKFPLYKRLLSLYPYKWIYKYQANKNTVKLLVYLESIFLFLTCFFSIPIILNMYLGVLIYRTKIEIGVKRWKENTS